MTKKPTRKRVRVPEHLRVRTAEEIREAVATREFYAPPSGGAMAISATMMMALMKGGSARSTAPTPWGVNKPHRPAPAGKDPTKPPPRR